jgi:hypothetical protein
VLRVTVLTILVLLTASAQGVTVIERATFKPVAIPTPRTINPDLIEALPTKIVFFDSLSRDLGLIDRNDVVEMFDLPAAPGEVLTVTSFALGEDDNLWLSGMRAINQVETSFVARVGVTMDERLVGPPVFYNGLSPDFCRTISAPCVLAAAEDALWLSGGSTGKVAKVTYIGIISEFPVTPSTVHGVTVDGNGHPWVTSGSPNRVFELSPAGSLIGSIRIGGTRSFVGPDEIVTSPDGKKVCLTESGANGNAVACVDTLTKAVQEFFFPTPNSTPFDLDFGSDGLLYVAQFTARQLAQVNTSTGQIAESPFEGGIIPDEVIAFPPDGSGDVDLAVNTRNPAANFDSTPVRVEIGPPPRVPQPILVITKTPVGRAVPVGGSASATAVQVRSGDFAEFLLEVRNIGDAPTTAPAPGSPGWHIVEDNVPGLFLCSEKIEGAAKFVESRDGQGRLVLTPDPAAMPVVLDRNASVKLTIRCAAVVSAPGYITNRARATGGGSDEHAAEARVFGLPSRDAERISPSLRRIGARF